MSHRTAGGPRAQLQKLPQKTHSLRWARHSREHCMCTARPQPHRQKSSGSATSATSARTGGCISPPTGGGASTGGACMWHTQAASGQEAKQRRRPDVAIYTPSKPVYSEVHLVTVQTLTLLPTVLRTVPAPLAPLVTATQVLATTLGLARTASPLFLPPHKYRIPTILL